MRAFEYTSSFSAGSLAADIWLVSLPLSPALPLLVTLAQPMPIYVYT